MPKCDFNKVRSNFVEITLRHGCSPVNLLHIFITSFPKNTFEELDLKGFQKNIRISRVSLSFVSVNFYKNIFEKPYRAQMKNGHSRFSLNLFQSTLRKRIQKTYIVLNSFYDISGFGKKSYVKAWGDSNSTQIYSLRRVQ